MLCNVVDVFVVAVDVAVVTVAGQHQRVDGDEVAWFLLTSSNLSRSAWGFLDKKVKHSHLRSDVADAEEVPRGWAFCGGRLFRRVWTVYSISDANNTEGSTLVRTAVSYE